MRKLNKITRELKAIGSQVTDELNISKREHQELVEQGRRVLEARQKKKLEEELAKLELKDELI